MQKYKLLIIIGTTLIAVGLLVFFLFFYNAFGIASKYSQQTRTIIFTKISKVSSFTNELTKIKRLAQENLALRVENQRLLSIIATQNEFKDENEFLRRTLGLNPPTESNFTAAKIFNVQFTPGGHYFLINKGTKHHIKPGDIVISSTSNSSEEGMDVFGTILGSITDVSDDFSRASAITNLDIKTTVKIFDKKTSGIALGRLTDGLYVDFISQEDEISIDDILVTSGNDLAPPGLIVGTVTSIDVIGGNLFKKVIARPAFTSLDMSRVIIIHN